jgi:membrane protein implicated in regulation of membrane protease activity
MLLVVALLLAVFVLDEPWSWAVVAVGGALEAVESWLYIRWSQRRRPQVGVEALIGKHAVVTAECRPEGQVRVAGELWQACCEAGAAAGDEVVVRAVDGLSLVVEPAFLDSPP